MKIHKGFHIMVVVFMAIGSVAQAGEMNEAKVFEKTAPGVVYIHSANEDGGGQQGTGSVIREDGLILTNAHVVLDKKEKTPFAEILVVFYEAMTESKPGAKSYPAHPAEVVAINENFDIALLKASGLSGPRPVLLLGDPKLVKVGDRVVAIGHPEGGAKWTLTNGTISAPIKNYADREGWDIFQTDASINRGNSGGPLLNQFGFLIGINVSTARISPIDNFPITDVNFSIQSGVAQQWLKEQGITLGYVNK